MGAETMSELRPGDVVELAIEEVVFRGKGLARHAGFVVFVPRTLPGERVAARVVRRHARYAEAEPVRIIESSATRRQPECSLADVCPGCAYQHADYPEEVRIKSWQLANMLARHAGVEPSACCGPVAAPNRLGYRNKIVLHGGVGGGRPVLGYYAADNETLVDVPACPLAAPPLNERLAELRGATEPADGTGVCRALTLRWTPRDGALHWAGRPPRDAAPLTESTCLGDLRVPRGSFFQVNPAVADACVQEVAALLSGLPRGPVVDLYCGVGVFALVAARLGFGPVVGVDVDEAAIGAARWNAGSLGLSGAIEFIAASAGRAAGAALRAMSGRGGVAIVDPPRTGLDRGTMGQILRHRPAHVLYLSCSADTLARDVRVLRGAEYRADSARMFDMFPRTAHFEALAHLVAETGSCAVSVRRLGLDLGAWPD
jgi:tRNA/tmRNA/rRNA uracil-C5-methylase (TrmA/RlmC/RlmD family)